MAKALQVGDLVVAVSEIVEESPDGTQKVHAPPGASGTIVQLGLQGGWPTIRWESGFACPCMPGGEFVTVRSFDLTHGEPANA